jgi:hypothetical protein
MKIPTVQIKLISSPMKLNRAFLSRIASYFQNYEYFRFSDSFSFSLRSFDRNTETHLNGFHLDSNNRQHFDRDSIELIETTPSSSLSQPFIDVSDGTVVHLFRAIEHVYHHT